MAVMYQWLQELRIVIALRVHGKLVAETLLHLLAEILSGFHSTSSLIPQRHRSSRRFQLP